MTTTTKLYLGESRVTPKVAAGFWSIESVPGQIMGIKKLHVYGSEADRNAAIACAPLRGGIQNAISDEQVTKRCRAQTSVVDHRDGFLHNGLDYVR